MDASTTESTEVDTALVRAALEGDRAAMAGIYDRYGDRVHDMCLHMLRDRDEAADVTAEVFLMAFQRLGQLRDPRRLRSWLFAIARHEVFRRSRRRSRVQLMEEVDQMDRLVTDAAARDGVHEAPEVDTAALATLLRDASAGLDERDRMVMELQLQGLDGEEMAAALGTSVTTGYQQVHRMKERLERSLGAVLVARQGRGDCDELDRVLAGWDGTFSVLWRKRVARHVDACETCDRRRRAVPATLFGGAALAVPMLPTAAVSAAPAGVRERVVHEAVLGGGGRPWRRDGFPPRDDGARRRLAATVALALGVVLVVLLLALWARTGEDRAERVMSLPGSSTTGVSASSPEVSTTLAPATTSTVPPAPPPSSPVAPGPTTSVPGTIAPPAPTPAPPPAAVPPAPTPPLSGGPDIELVRAPSTVFRPSDGFDSCGASAEIAASSPDADEVQLWWRAADGRDGIVGLAAVPGGWIGVLEVPMEVQGPLTLLAVAIDELGRSGVSETRSAVVADCPVPG